MAPLRWRTRAFVLLGVGGAFLALGVALAAPALLFLGLPLLLAPLAATMYSAPGGAPAVVRWQVEGSGPTVDVVGRIDLARGDRSEDHELTLARPPALGERAPPRIEYGDGSISFAFSWAADRPVIADVARPRLVWSDPAGLVERRIPLEGEDLVVERYPPELLRLGRAHLERTIALPGETRSRRIGTSGEFFGLRDATPNEPPRRINWRASARAGRLLANEFQLDRTGDVLILIDARPTVLGPAADSRLLALSLAAAYGVAESFLREKARVGVGVFGEFLDVVPLGNGRTHRLRIRTTLLRARLVEQPGPAERCAIATRRHFPPGVTTIVFSSLGDEESDLLIRFLRRRGYPPLVVSPSPTALTPGGARLSDPEEEVAERLARLVRRERVARVWEQAPVVDWDSYWSLGGLADLLGRPGRWGRRT